MLRTLKHGLQMAYLKRVNRFARKYDSLDHEIKERILKEKQENQFEFNKDKFMAGLEAYYRKIETSAIKDSDFVKDYKRSLVSDDGDPVRKADMVE